MRMYCLCGVCSNTIAINIVAVEAFGVYKWNSGNEESRNAGFELEANNKIGSEYFNSMPMMLDSVTECMQDSEMFMWKHICSGGNVLKYTDAQ